MTFQPLAATSADTFSLLDVANAALAVVRECVEGSGGRSGTFGLIEGGYFDLLVSSCSDGRLFW